MGYSATADQFRTPPALGTEVDYDVKDNIVCGNRIVGANRPINWRSQAGIVHHNTIALSTNHIITIEGIDESVYKPTGAGEFLSNLIVYDYAKDLSATQTPFVLTSISDGPINIRSFKFDNNAWFDRSASSIYPDSDSWGYWPDDLDTDDSLGKLDPGIIQRPGEPPLPLARPDIELNDMIMSTPLPGRDSPLYGKGADFYVEDSTLYSPMAEDMNFKAAYGTPRYIKLSGSPIKMGYSGGNSDDFVYTIVDNVPAGKGTLQAVPIEDPYYKYYEYIYTTPDDTSIIDQSTSFTYTVTDNGVISTTATATINIEAANNTPIVPDRSLSTDEDLALVITEAMLNITNEPTDTIEFSIFEPDTYGPENGSISIDNTNLTITYTPDENYYGQDSFVYMVDDSYSFATATIALTINPINDAPLVTDQYFLWDEPATHQLISDDVDNDPAQDHIFSLVGEGTTEEDGWVTLHPDGSFEYTAPDQLPADKLDTFEFTVSDGDRVSQAKVFIMIDDLAVLVTSQIQFFKAVEYPELILPGTKFLIPPGIITGKVWNISNVHGTAEAPVIISGINPHNRPIFTDVNSAFTIHRCSYLVIKDIIIDGPSSNGIAISDGRFRRYYTERSTSHHITIDNIEVRAGNAGNFDPIKVTRTDFFTVRNCRFEGWGGEGQGSAIDCVGCQYGLIENNYLAHAKGNGVQLKGGSRSILVRNNKFFEATPNAASVKMGGTSGLDNSRPWLGYKGQDYEGKDHEICGNIFHSNRMAFTFMRTDGGYVHHNTIAFVDHIISILGPTASDKRQDLLAFSHDGVISNNLVIYSPDVETEDDFIFHTGDVDLTTYSVLNNAWYRIGSGPDDGDIPFSSELPGANVSGNEYGAVPDLYGFNPVTGEIDSRLENDPQFLRYESNHDIGDRLYDKGADFYLDPAPDVMPEVEAGDSQDIVYTDLPGQGAEAFLQASLTPSPPRTVKTIWNKISGPGDVNFDDDTALDSRVTFTETGTYVLRLTAYYGALTAEDEITITVRPHDTVEYDLTVGVNGLGSVVPAGSRYYAGEVADITAVPAEGYFFSHWNGESITSENEERNSLHLVMDDHKAITANFIEASQIDVTAGLVAHWTFDDGLTDSNAVTAEDSSGNQNDGTLINGVEDEPPVWTDGIIGGALEFDGGDKYVRVEHDDSLNVDSLTMAAWVWKESDTISNRSFLEKASAYRMQLGTNWRGEPSRCVYAYTTVERWPKDLYLNAGYVPLQEWCHVAVTWNGFTAKSYINGKLADEFAYYLRGDIYKDINRLVLGANVYSNEAYSMRGKLDDVRIYNRPLSVAEIAALASVGLRPVVPGDVDDDGNIEAEDAIWAAKIVVGAIDAPPSSRRFQAANVDTDNVVTLKDVLMIARMAIGAIE